MSHQPINCVLLADRHHGLAERLRGLLESTFEAVVMVADATSLLTVAAQMQPILAVVDLSLEPGEGLPWLPRLRARCPNLKLIVLSVHDEPSVCHSAIAAGVDAFVLKRSIATDLLPSIDALLPGMSPASGGEGRPEGHDVEHGLQAETALRQRLHSGTSSEQP